MSDRYAVVTLDEMALGPQTGAHWHPVRRTLGIQAFGINAWTATEDGQQVIGEHAEVDGGAEHEEVYVVVSGHASFTLDGTTFDAPAGTVVHVPDPTVKRGAVGESGTTILFTTHLMEEADRCDRVAILDAGRIVALDAPGALKATLGGDVVTVHAEEPESLKPELDRRLAVESRVLDGALRIERERGHELVREVAEAFGGRVRSITLGKPTLEDVFIHRTGRRFE